MKPGSTFDVKPPYTIYTAGVLWRRGESMVISNPVQLVSGDNPLTPAEARARLVGECVEFWNEQLHGPHSGWTIPEGGIIVRWLVVK